MNRQLLAVLAVLLACAAPAAAQQDELVIAGRVLGPESTPLEGQTVVLHRVKDMQGATITETVTAADGRFELRAPAEADTTALYFVAARHEGELYIGAAFRPGQEAPPPQILQVGVPGTSASALLGAGGGTSGAVGRPLTSRSWMLFAIPLLGVAAVAVYMLTSRGRLPHDRSLLIRIAELDERMHTLPTAAQGEMRSERERLMTMLRSG